MICQAFPKKSSKTSNPFLTVIYPLAGRITIYNDKCHAHQIEIQITMIWILNVKSSTLKWLIIFLWDLMHAKNHNNIL